MSLTTAACPTSSLNHFLQRLSAQSHPMQRWSLLTDNSWWGTCTGQFGASSTREVDVCVLGTQGCYVWACTRLAGSSSTKARGDRAVSVCWGCAYVPCVLQLPLGMSVRLHPSAWAETPGPQAPIWVSVAKWEWSWARASGWCGHGRYITYQIPILACNWISP